MKYKDVIQYLYEQLPMFHRVGASAYKADLSATIQLAKMLGNPEKQFKSLHIAGTNGKGSVSNMLASILMENGYKTALFTSPHLVDFRERIRINGKMIPQKEVTSFVNSYKKAFNEISPSFFEWTWALASWYFAKEKVDIAVIETGMGGRFDSTNIINPELCIVTNIGYDHVQFLGDTLGKIAAEKAGIFKYKVPVIIGESNTETDNVFMAKAIENLAAVTFADRKISIVEAIPANENRDFLHAEFQISYTPEIVKVNSPLSGVYQLKNIATTITAVLHLKENGWIRKEDSLERGIQNTVKNTGFEGRWQRLSKNPLVVADIAHNAAGIESVLENLNNFSFSKLRIVLGVVNDKDVEMMLSLLPKEAVYYFCKADIPRGRDVNILKEKAEKFSLKGNIYTSVKEAFLSAKKDATEEDMILVTGSAFVVAEVLDFQKK
jgi:dihydrofolate synthase / folylpolyglutamate synthase